MDNSNKEDYSKKEKEIEDKEDLQLELTKSNQNNLLYNVYKVLWELRYEKYQCRFRQPKLSKKLNQ